jgi:hypothetical protein
VSISLAFHGKTVPACGHVAAEAWTGRCLPVTIINFTMVYSVLTDSFGQEFDFICNCLPLLTQHIPLLHISCPIFLGTARRFAISGDQSLDARFGLAWAPALRFLGHFF